MARLLLLVVLVVSVIQAHGMVQVQMPEAAELHEDEQDLQSQIHDLQKNVTDIWAYMYELKNAVSGHLKHLRVHQAVLESSMHRMEHLHDSGSSSPGSDSHHHSGEHHSHGEDHAHDDAHGSDHHSHSDDHIHGSDHQSHSDDHSHGSEPHSHSDDHSHGSELHSHSDDHSHGSEHHSHGDDHSHGSEHHSHGDDHSHGSESHSHGDDHSHGTDQHFHGDDHSSDHHSHGDDHSHGADAASHLHSHGSEHGSEQHGHGGEHNFHDDDHGHHSHSESHSHTTHDHSKEDHSHGSDHQDHKDSHETEDFSQQTQKVDPGPGPVSEPVVVATNANSLGRIHPAHSHHGHNHTDHHGHNHQGHSHGQGMGGRRVQPTSTATTNRIDLMNGHDFHRHHHQHHHHSHDKNKNKTVEIPKYADYNLYDFATCSVQPNRAIPEDEQQNVGGTIVFWQKKSGGPLNIHIKVRGFQMGDHHGHHSAQQAIQQEEASVVPQEEEEVSKGGHTHGFHIHASGDLSNGCQNTGDHYNPKNVNHGGPHAMNRHVGDLGNIECDEHGVTNIMFSDDVASLRGLYSIIGKAAVIHANQDDLGLGGDPESLKTGNAGTRIACCVIQKTEKLPIRYYKAMKTATQYKN